MQGRLVNLEEMKANVRSFEHNPWAEYMVINPHMLTEPANEYLYYYRKWGDIFVDHTKMVDGTLLYYYKKKRSRI